MVKMLNQILISPEATIKTAVVAIDTSSQQIALIVDANRKLLGTVTDGDVRRGLLRGVGLEDTVERVMNPKPITIPQSLDRQTILRRMSDLQLHHLPVVDSEGHLVGLEILDDLLKTEREDNWVVLMAGGLGTRLRPITETVPKPMVPVGGRPLLESILNNFTAQGFGRFFLSVNYKADMVRDHFGDGNRFGTRIDYLQEAECKGTAGALSLLPERPDSPLIVMNGDLLTSVNFRYLLDFHRAQKAAATMCVRDYSIQVPYGVVETDRNCLIRLTEKPVHHFFVNAGIYVIEPDVLDLIPRDHPFDMTELFQALTAHGESAAVFPIHEYWLDIGRLDDLERARSEYDGIFALPGNENP